MEEPLQSPGPGWDLIDRALAELPAIAGPFRFDVRTVDDAEPPALDGIAVLPRDDHWHYVTYGLTELYEKSAPDARVSGFGFELTFRIPRPRGQPSPPAWPAELLRSVASYVARSGEQLEPGHHVDVGGPITSDAPTVLCAALVVADPELVPRDGPFGRVGFLQLVGLADDELDLLIDWDPDGLRQLLAEDDARLVTNPGRASLLADEARRRLIVARVAREGSALDALYLPLAAHSDGHRAQLALPAASVSILRRLLHGRLVHGRALTIEGGEGTLVLRPGTAPAWHREGDALVVELPAQLAREWRDELSEQPGGIARALMQDLWVRIVPADP